ncbi:unnamed protein product [Prorocentrum cordatum]|uniref:Uncharacterized protein n=1 Tax=Prorocentrum cordatum TaxID=2364126 RepID=A0ABN9XH23_9DINO|nr:unnamed protein product [Polarella glacialis]CAK0897469.1 unnamed protein product [Polarella glacialis]
MWARWAPPSEVSPGFLFAMEGTWPWTGGAAQPPAPASVPLPLMLLLTPSRADQQRLPTGPQIPSWAADSEGYEVQAPPELAAAEVDEDEDDEEAGSRMSAARRRTIRRRMLRRGALARARRDSQLTGPSATTSAEADLAAGAAFVISL